MNISVKKKASYPVFILILVLTLVLPVFANALCPLCQGYNTIECTGVDTSDTYSHTPFKPFDWIFKKCTYYKYRHAVATSCCNASWGSHIYRTTVHPCGDVEEEFPCEDVPDWVMDP